MIKVLRSAAVPTTARCGGLAVRQSDRTVRSFLAELFYALMPRVCATLLRAEADRSDAVSGGRAFGLLATRPLEYVPSAEWNDGDHATEAGWGTVVQPAQRFHDAAIADRPGADTAGAC